MAARATKQSRSDLVPSFPETEQFRRTAIQRMATRGDAERHRTGNSVCGSARSQSADEPVAEAERAGSEPRAYPRAHIPAHCDVVTRGEPAVWRALRAMTA